MNTTTSARSLVVISVITYSRTRRTLQYDTRTSVGERGAGSVTGAPAVASPVLFWSHHINLGTLYWNKRHGIKRGKMFQLFTFNYQTKNISLKDIIEFRIQPTRIETDGFLSIIFQFASSPVHAHNSSGSQSQLHSTSHSYGQCELCNSLAMLGDREDLILLLLTHSPYSLLSRLSRALNCCNKRMVV
jgi:hypothetical protein